MTRWWTSDHHFGHRNIITYCDRPFEDVDEMHCALVDNWNAEVNDDDEVWVLGDLVLQQSSVNLMTHVSRMKGRKILVPGNHDACWQGHTKGVRKVAQYLNLGGFEEIIDRPEPVIIAGEEVQMSHFPYRDDRPDRPHPERFTEWRPTDTGRWLLCGHIHDLWRQQGKQINVGVDAWEFAPVSEDVLAEIIRNGPAQLAPLPLA